MWQAKEISSRETIPVRKFELQAEYKLNQMMGLIYLGDWVSYYLAMLNEIDPTPVKAIDYLKKRLSQAK